MQHFIVYDLETSGLYPEEGAEIVQIAAKAIHFSTLADHSAGNLSLLVKPKNPEKASADAIRVIGEELWENAKANGLEPELALKKVKEYAKGVQVGKTKFDRPIMVGHNIQFDFNFSKFWMKHYKVANNEDEFPFHIRPFCTAQMLQTFWGHLPDIKNNRLDTLLAVCNLSRGGTTHDAVEDVNLTAQAFVRTLRFARECQRRMKPTETTPIK